MRRLLAALLSLFLVGEAHAQGFNPPTLFTPRFQAVLTNSTATTLTEIVAAPGAGLSLYITDITMSASAAATATADQQLNLKYGTGAACATGTTVIMSYFNAATAGVTVKLGMPIKLPAVNALCFMDAVTGNKSVTVGGYIAP